MCACVKVCALQQIFGCYKEGTDGSRYLRQDPNLAEKKPGESYFKSGDALAAAVTSMAYCFLGVTLDGQDPAPVDLAVP